MADILIRGVRMPVACSDCPSRDVSVCMWTDDYNVESYKFSRPSFCPLHKLPEHGDLISLDDAKTVITRFLGYIDDDLVFRMKFMLGKDCPVIVPSNKEETE